MVDAPERIWATFEPHESGKGHPHTYATAAKTKGHEYVRADRHAELAAESERQALAIDAYKAMLAQAEQDIARSRTGAVKVKALDDLVQVAFDAYIPIAGECPVEPAMEAAISAVLSTLEPAAPEGQQEPVVWQWRQRPIYKTSGRKGEWSDWVDGRAPFLRVANYEAEERPLYTRPSEQAVTEAARDVLAERRRQIEAEGWTPEHDNQHASGELAIAAACYALNATDDSDGPEIRFVGAELWPWADEWWKPTDRRRDLVKAGALILAEIERIDRRAALKAAMEAGR